MGYVLKVRLASFFAGAAAASAFGLYLLHRDYKMAHQAISHQVPFPSPLYSFISSYPVTLGSVRICGKGKLFFLDYYFLDAWVHFSIFI